MKYVIEGIPTPPSFKNGKVLVYVSGKPRIITRADRKKWMKIATAQLVSKRNSAGIPPAKRIITRRVDMLEKRFVSVTIHRAGGRMADPDGMLSTIMDCLVKAKILADDSPRYVQSVELKWCEGEENLTEINVF